MEYFDLHADTFYELHKDKKPLYHNDLAVSVFGAKEFSCYVQIFAVWIPDDAPYPFALYQNIIQNSKEELEKNSKDINFMSTKTNGMNALLSVEGGRLLEGDISRIGQMYNDGVRLITLTWNGDNDIAGGALEKGDLTAFGRQVIDEMNRLGMAVDLAHLNRKSFFSALPLCKYPIVTHSCFDALHPHLRNLTDEQFAGLCKQNGIMGICFYPEFLGGGDVFEQIYKQIMHACYLGGEDNIAFGSDFDGAEMDTKLCKISQISSLFDFLVKKGIKAPLLNKLFFDNSYKFIAKVLTNAPK